MALHHTRRAIRCTLLGTTILAAAVTMAPRDAAACGCLPPAFASTIATSTGAISVGFGALTTLINQGFAAVNAALASQASAWAEVASAQNNIIAQTQQQVLAHETERNFMQGFDICGNILPASRAGENDQQRTAVERELNEVDNRWNRNLSADTAGTAAGNAAVRIQTRLGQFCGEADAAQGLCEPTELGDIDVQAGNLLNNKTLNEEQLAGAHAFKQNLVGMPPPRQTTQSVTSINGSQEAVDRLARDARTSAAMSLLSHQISLKSEIADDAMKRFTRLMNEEMTGQSGEPENAAEENEGPSVYEIMEMSAERRFKDSKWLSGIIDGTPEMVALLKELTMMEATNLHHDWKRFELEQHMATNLAAMLAARTDEAFIHDE